jgi:hypothetical protein
MLIMRALGLQDMAAGSAPAEEVPADTAAAAAITATIPATQAPDPSASAAEEQLQAALEAAQCLGLGPGAMLRNQNALYRDLRPLAPISPEPLSNLMQQMLAEQRRTNELLQQLVEGLPGSGGCSAASSLAIVCQARAPLTGARMSGLLESLQHRRSSRQPSAGQCGEVTDMV